jgi:hypothetical protein
VPLSLALSERRVAAAGQVRQADDAAALGQVNAWVPLL